MKPPETRRVRRYDQTPVWSACDWIAENIEELEAIERYRKQSEQATKEERA